MRLLPGLSLWLLAVIGLEAAAQPNNLDIYWIDVEGGAATLIVTPARQSVLMDAGWGTEDDRDAERIVAAMTHAGIDELDYFIASHFHGDHVGGVPALASRVPIRQFIDHGDSVEQDRERSVSAWEAYLSAADGNRRSVVPGDELTLDGIGFTFVTSHGEILREQPGQPGENPFCANAFPGEPDMGENARSVGYLLTLGEFEFLNLGDLTPNVQHELACPQYRLGVVDLLQVPHHGNGIAPQLMAAINPTVAVLNNGATKGGSAEGFDALRVIADLAGLWQLHRALGTDDLHNASEPMTANLTDEADAGHWIHAEVSPDGSTYTVTNSRNAVSETYRTKPN